MSAKIAFIAWNGSFRSLAGYTNEALQVASLKEIVVLGEPQPIREQGSLPISIDLVPFTLRIYNDERLATGHAAKRDDGFLLLIPDVADPDTGAIDDARTFGREEEPHSNIQSISRPSEPETSCCDL